MLHRKLIVARMDPTHASSVAEVFAESDAGELPRMLGVTRRGLFHFKGLYFHLFESEEDVGARLAGVHDHPLFMGINRSLARFISPYDPQTWRGPSDAMAHEFYSWQSK
jgi:cyclase